MRFSGNGDQLILTARPKPGGIFELGQRVRLCGLVSSKHLNGRVGTVVSLPPAVNGGASKAGRVGVALAESRGVWDDEVDAEAAAAEAAAAKAKKPVAVRPECVRRLGRLEAFTDLEVDLGAPEDEDRASDDEVEARLPRGQSSGPACHLGVWLALPDGCPGPSWLGHGGAKCDPGGGWEDGEDEDLEVCSRWQYNCSEMGRCSTGRGTCFCKDTNFETLEYDENPKERAWYHHGTWQAARAHLIQFPRWFVQKARAACEVPSD